MSPRYATAHGRSRAEGTNDVVSIALPHFEHAAARRTVPARTILYVPRAVDAGGALAAASPLAPERVRESANGVQALANLDGIVTTRRALHAP